jgi:hypothetical protein
MDPRFALTEYVVEANSFEKFALWKEHSNSHEWKQDAFGLMIQIGEIGGRLQEKRPICISCYWSCINGMNVLFYYACSQLVDYRMVEEWFKKNCYPYEAKSKRAAKCDADNFHSCLHYSKEDRPKLPEDDKGLIIFPPFRYGKASKSLS